MYLLDSNTYTHYQRGNPKVVAQVEAVSKRSLWLPAIVVEEQLRGRLAIIAGLNPKHEADSLKTPAAYALFLKTFSDLSAFQRSDYTAEMEALYQSWPASVKRLGTQDCRIAATAIVLGFTVITCNLSHYRPIPKVDMGDWNRA